MEFQGKKITVMGLGRSGKALAYLLADKGAEVLISDMKKVEGHDADIEALQAMGVKFELGGHSERVYSGKDLIIISPGISIYNSFLVDAKKAGVPVIGEIEVAFSLTEAPIIAVTGTNGKSTTVSLIHKILVDSGKKAVLAGNIGIPLVAEIEKNPDAEWIVAEVSSFQLETVSDFNPRIGVVMNITDDHMDRHHSLDEYIEAKTRLFTNHSNDDYAVLNEDDRNVRTIIPRVASKVYTFSRTCEVERGVFLRGREIMWRDGALEKRLLSVDEIPLIGSHNVENVMAAAAVITIAGVEGAQVVRSLPDFKALHHRIQYVATIDGIRFYDDSKGTNPGAVIAAMESFQDPVILIAGGKDKDMDFSSMAEVMAKKLKKLIVIGETANKIADAAHSKGVKDIESAAAFKEAVYKAFQSARPGDVVLLSPACASFDMFKSAEERGDIFIQIVKEMEELKR
ncbi:MAG: UDP-N-acetylmuramoyl-L-alanine--D-glutamate ligase [Vulcanimicrobiota bacterium]